jgi:hypothetical protein
MPSLWDGSELIHEITKPIRLLDEREEMGSEHSD